MNFRPSRCILNMAAAIAVLLLTGSTLLTTPAAFGQTLGPDQPGGGSAPSGASGELEDTLLDASSWAALPNAESASSQGSAAFLASLPLARPYTANAASERVNSFFDHGLPLYWRENLSSIPADLRDSSRDRTTITFLNERLTNPGNSCITLGVDCYSGHDGVDFDNVTPAQDVVAPADGRIVYGREAIRVSDGQQIANTCLVIIEHDTSNPADDTPDYTTKYMHLSSIGAAAADQRGRPGRPDFNQWVAGDRIRAGQVIGQTGNDPCGGSSDGEHLHFGVGAGSAQARLTPRPFDPFGWWSQTGDPWADGRLERVSGLSVKPAISLWSWAAPRRSNQWDEGVAAQTDDADASFHLFGPSGRLTAWRPVLAADGAGVRPIGSGAWRSTSLQNTGGARPNWAIWGLHVPADGSYRVQVFLPQLPPQLTATSTAKYTLYAHDSRGVMQAWTLEPLNQQGMNEWRDLVGAGQQTLFNLTGGRVVLVKLTDVTGKAGDAVIFDAIRLRPDEPVVEPPPTLQRRVAFAVDNSSSLVEAGKMNALKSALSSWVDQLESEAATKTSYAMVAFAENLAANLQTDSAAAVKSWVSALSANDNGIDNSDCPEISLDAIKSLATQVQGGHMLLFTDDLPKGALTRTGGALGALLANNVKLHAVLLPKTCYFTPDDYDPLAWLPYRMLALATGGTYQSVGTAETGAALSIVLSEMRASSQLDVRSGGAMMRGTSAASDIFPIPVDGSIRKLNILLNIIEGDATLTVNRPDGSIVLPGEPGVRYTGTSSAQYYEFENPAAGEWTATVSGDPNYRFSVSADTAVALTYLGAMRGSVGAPASVVVRLTGAVQAAQFSVVRPDGQVVADLDLRDNGVGNDMRAGDGLFSGWYTPTVVGEYAVSVAGVVNGQAVQRVDSRQFFVSGVSVTAPGPRMVPIGSESRLDFTVRNATATTQIFDIVVETPNRWISRTPAASVVVSAQKEAVVPIYVRPPANATPGSLEVLWLTVTQRSDTTVVAEASVYLTTESASYSGDQNSNTLYAPYVAR